MIQEIQKQIHAFVGYTPHNCLMKQDFMGLDFRMAIFSYFGGLSLNHMCNVITCHFSLWF